LHFCNERRARGTSVFFRAAPFVNNKISPALAAYAGKCILITGAGGYIGSALTARLAASAPRFLVLLDNSEQNLHELDMALREQGVTAYAAILGDVCDLALLEEILERFRPENIFHAAACKHVPLMEHNPLAAVRTNALGTWQLVKAANRSGAEQLLLISTDKAVKPASVMGATKRVAELALERMAGGNLRLQAVRLGNVLGSHGSVVPLFTRQISQGGPVTVTHAEAERYFFTLDETVEIILWASALGPGTFIPKLKPAVKISDLADKMIRAARNESDRAVEVKITGMRPGDKLREEFLNEGEHSELTEEENVLRVCGPKRDDGTFDAAMHRLQDAVPQRRLETAMEVLRELVPAYRPSQVVLEMLREGSVAKA
jgi:FlaA1/EpsC-like NDP-sugar epimerase